MRYEKTTLSTFLLSVLLATLIPLAALMCLSETFLLERGLGQMLPLCLLMGAAAALSVMPRRYWPILAAEGVALLLFVECLDRFDQGLHLLNLFSNAVQHVRYE